MKNMTIYLEVTIGNNHPFIKAFEGTVDEVFLIAFEYTKDLLETELEKYDDASETVRFEYFVDEAWSFTRIEKRVYIPSDLARGPHYEYVATYISDDEAE